MNFFFYIKFYIKDIGYHIHPHIVLLKLQFVWNHPVVTCFDLPPTILHHQSIFLSFNTKHSQEIWWTKPIALVLMEPKLVPLIPKEAVFPREPVDPACSPIPQRTNGPCQLASTVAPRQPVFILFWVTIQKSAGFPGETAFVTQLHVENLHHQTILKTNCRTSSSL